jgi:type IV secretion system protein VirB2
LVVYRGDLDEHGPLPGAVDWLASLLLGPVASVVAVLAVASVGFLMLSGRVSLHRGASVVLGCFILFSARSIASALIVTTSLEGEPVASAAPPVPAVYAPAKLKAEPYDPYSGAAVPDQSSSDLLN